MNQKPLKRAKSLLKRIRDAVQSSDELDIPEAKPEITPFVIHDPVNSYYQHRLKTNPAAFNRFALQTRSLTIRDTYALAASDGRQHLAELLSTIRHYGLNDSAEDKRTNLQALYDCDLLLALADLLSNTSRNDLDTFSAVNLYEFVLETYGDDVFDEHNKLQYVEALLEVGQYGELQRFTKKFLINELAPLQEELLNIQRIRFSAPEPARAWIEAINDLYDELNMTRISLLEDATSPMMDRLQRRSSSPEDGPKVSVIVPTYSPGPGIRTAIRGLLEQTWSNLEIIVVDDASPDKYQDLFLELEVLDPRIRVLRQSENLGAYVARNVGLTQAIGSYVTTHDDDDWSHPDKIAAQVRIMENDDNIVATTSSHIRTTQDLVFKRVNSRAKYLQMNYSSLMFRKWVTDEIGAWDRVNRGGDSEFLTRVIENFGEERVVHLEDKPLSFSRVWEGSLTSGEMSRGFFGYSRLLYRWSFRQWQWDVAKTGNNPIHTSGKPRPYAIPTTFEAGARNQDLGLFDVIYVTDFFRKSKFVDFALDDIKILVTAGYRVGYMHLYSPQTNQHTGLPKELFDLQLQGKITQVSHDDQAATRLLIVYDASLGMYADQIQSSVVVHKGVIIDHELPALSGGETRSPTCIHQSLNNLDRVFGTSLEVVGATFYDHRRLSKTVPRHRLLPGSYTWTPHLEVKPNAIVSPGSKPTVGFHSFGSIYRWPQNKHVFNSIYHSKNFATRLYGQLDAALVKFGEDSFQPIDVVDFRDQTESAFMESIDFWVYFPHTRLEDQIWRPVLAALQAGKVVILPPRLRHIYGDAAVYARPEEVEDTVSNLSNDSNAYVSQAETGRAFVADRFSSNNFIRRIEGILALTGPRAVYEDQGL